MNQAVINLLASIAPFADEEEITQWLKLLLPKEVVDKMEPEEKRSYLESLRSKN